MLSHNAITSWLAILLVGLVIRFVMVFVRHFEIKEPTWKDVSDSIATALLYAAFIALHTSVAESIFQFSIKLW